MFYLSLDKSCYVPKERKLIGSIYSKNNNYFLLDRTYEDDKTLALTKTHGLLKVVPPKKIVNYLGFTINDFTNNAIISNDISLD